MKDNANPVIRKYIQRLKKSLKHLSAADREEIVREIEGHIVERWEADSKGSCDAESLRGVMGKLGGAEAIAAQYCEQRGWARPPASHTLRNTLLILTGIAAVTILGVVYMGTRYVISPAIDMVSGFRSMISMDDDAELVKIDDNGIRVLNGKITVNDDGVSIKGIGTIKDVDDEKILSLFGQKVIAEEAKEFSLPAREFKSMKLVGDNGHIAMTGSDADVIEIKYTKKIFGKNEEAAKEFLNEVEVRQDSSGGEFKIESVLPKIKPRGISGGVINYDVKVPARLAVNLVTDNGRVDINNIVGRVEVNSDNGKVNVTNIGADVDVEGDNGRVQIENVKGSVRAKTDNGAINLEHIGGSVEAESDNGSIDALDIGKNLKVTTDNASIDIENVRGDIEASTDNGSVEVVLAKNYEFKFSGESEHGRVRCDFPTEREGRVVSGTVGGGTNQIKIKTGTGSIDVKRES